MRISEASSQEVLAWGVVRRAVACVLQARGQWGQWARCARELSGGARVHSKLPVMLDTAQVPGTELRGGGSPEC